MHIIGVLTGDRFVSLAGKARVNSISPGWIDTTGSGITGENFCIDSGITKLMIYHGEHGWSYDGKGL